MSKSYSYALDQGRRNRGGGGKGAAAPQFLADQLTRGEGQIMPTTLLLASYRILRPSYGPVDGRRKCIQHVSLLLQLLHIWNDNFH